MATHTPEGLLHVGLENEDWALLLYATISPRKTVTKQELQDVFSLSKYELESSLGKLVELGCFEKNENDELERYVSNVGM